MEIYKKSVYDQIKHEMDTFLNSNTEIIPGFEFNQYDTVRKITLYDNSLFESGGTYQAGNKKKQRAFHNVSSFRRETASKMIDLDTANIKLLSEDENSDFGVYLMEKQVHKELEEDNWARILNKISDELPAYGSVVLYKNRKDSFIVDLKNLFNDPEAEYLSDARYVILRENLSIPEVIERGWDIPDIENYLTNKSKSMKTSMNVYTNSMKEVGSPYVEIYHRFGDVPLEWVTNLEKDSKTYVKAHFIVCGIEKDIPLHNGNTYKESKFHVLQGKVVTDFPFEECHYQKVKGRWLGLGIIEKMFEIQRVTNQLLHYQMEQAEFEALNVFQVDDSSMLKQNISNLVSGDIIRYKNKPIERLDMSKSGGTVQNMLNYVDILADKTTFAYDTVRGESAPASATLGAVQIQTNSAGSLFDYKKENISIFLNMFIKRLILPDILKKFKNGGVLKFIGTQEELFNLKDSFATRFAMDHMKDAFERNELVTSESFEGAKQIAMQYLARAKTHLWIDITNKYFEGLNFKVVITNENNNMTTEASNYLQLLQTVQGDPEMLLNPAKRKLFLIIARKLGIHQTEIDNLAQTAQEVSQINNPQQQAADAARTAAGQVPVSQVQ